MSAITLNANTRKATTVTLAAFPNTSLSDDLGNNLSFTGFDGTITISAVPEPTTWAMFGLSMTIPVAGWNYRRYRIRTQALRRYAR